MSDDDLPGGTLYHGTSRRSWSETENAPSSLYVSSDIEDARLYAYECAEGDECLGLAPEPLLVTISPSDLRTMLASGIVLEPDWGWVTGMEADARSRSETFEEPDWKASLSACHGICLSGFTEDLKLGLEITSLEVCVPDPAAP